MSAKQQKTKRAQQATGVVIRGNEFIMPRAVKPTSRPKPAPSSKR